MDNAPKPIKYSGAEWLQRSLKVESLSPFTKRVADLVGQVFRGIYHLEEPHQQDWGQERSESNIVNIYLSNELATYDSSELTELVILCHQQKIRLAIIPAVAVYERTDDGEYDLNSFLESKWADDLPLFEMKDASIVSCLRLQFTPRKKDETCVMQGHRSAEEAMEHCRILGEPLGWTGL